MATILLLWACASACGDDGGSNVSNDAAPPVDARLLDDAARIVCVLDAGSCDEQDYEKVCDTERSHCVECLSESDCQRPSALGPRCERSDNTCRCESSEGCESNEGGAYCQPLAGACGCLTIDDCPPESECKLEPYLGTGIRRCRPEQS